MNEFIVPRTVFPRASVFSPTVMRHFVDLGNDEIDEEPSTTVLTSGSHRRNGDCSSRREIVDLAKSIEDKLSKGEKFFSLELFSSKRCDRKVYERSVETVSTIP